VGILCESYTQNNETFGLNMKRIFTVVLALALGIFQTSVAPAQNKGSTRSAPVIVEKEYMLFEDLASAINYLIDKKDPKIIGFGEAHEEYFHLSPSPRPLSARFQEILPLLRRGEDHLIVERSPDPRLICNGHVPPEERLNIIFRTPRWDLNRWMATLHVAQGAGYFPHLLDYDCGDRRHLLRLEPDSYLKGPTLITAHAKNKVLEIEGARKSAGITMYYGGAIHNDMFPYSGWEHWSFGSAFTKSSGGRYLEIDLYVPEIMEKMVEQRDQLWLLSNDDRWYEIYQREGEKAPVFLFQRSENSYILVLERTAHNE